MSRSFNCVNSPNSFCYICGKYFFKCQHTQLRPITNDISALYQAYFKIPLSDNDKSWAPSKACTNCTSSLLRWKTSGSAMPFGIPMIWREPFSHPLHCYFCSTETFGFNKKTKSKLKYPDLESAMKPQPHLPNEPIPLRPQEEYMDFEMGLSDQRSLALLNPILSQ
jgi:hypothetical protein